MADLKLPAGFASSAVAIVVVLAAAFTLSGTNGKVADRCELGSG